MPRIIFKCPYLKGGSPAVMAHLKNLVGYIATRDGAEKIDPGNTRLAATNKQKELVAQLVQSFPESTELFEYEDYLSAPNRGNASAFITMASVLSTVLSRLNAFLDSEMEQILCFDTAVDAEKFCNEKSAIFVVLPEEDTTKYFMVSLIIQNLYREILTVADENGGRLKNRVVFFADELGSCPPIQSLELMFSASRSRGLMLVPIVQSITGQLQKNYGKEGSEIIVDNCQVNIFGGFAPASQTAEELSKALGSRTVMSGSISRGKNDPSQSLQMMERPLMTPDELKSMPKGSFIVAKTGVHPMRVRLRLFLDWGIRFGEPYEVPEKAQRPVAYADKQELEEAIIRRHYASSIEDEENQVDQGAAAAGGLSQGMRPEANRRKPALRP